MSRTLTRHQSFAGTGSQEVKMANTPQSTPGTPSVRGKIKPIQFPVVDSTTRLLHQHKMTRLYGKGTIVNLLLAIFFYCHLPAFLLSITLGYHSHMVGYATSGLCVVYACNTVFNFYQYLKSQFQREKVVLSEKQRTLLGINKEQERLFSDVKSSTPISKTPTSSSTPTVKTPSSYPIKRSSSRSSPPGSAGRGGVQMSPPRRNQYSPQRKSLDGTPLVGVLNQSQSSTPLNQSQSSPFLNSSQNSQGSPGRRWSPGRKSIGDDKMLDVEQVDEFLRREEVMEMKSKRSKPDSPKSLGASLWSYGRAAYEMVPVFGTYQLATRTQTPSAKDEDTSQNPLLYEELWRKLKVDHEDAVHWSENLRKWIAETILEPLMSEIKQINLKLIQIGSTDVQIGSATLVALKNASSTRSQQLPTLASILPYLEVTTNQEYLHSRLSQLAEGGSLRNFKWDEGGMLNGKAWTQELPTDTQLIVHLFCTYFDTHLPTNPRYPNGKSFTGLHFLKTPDKPTDKKSSICLYQSSMHKPHFKVLSESEVYDIPQGRHNLLHAISIFLKLVRGKHHGMLERVNLGSSGINILWILDKQKVI